MEHQLKSAIGQKQVVYFSAKEEKKRGISKENFIAKRYVSAMSKIPDTENPKLNKQYATKRKFYFINDHYDKVNVMLVLDEDGSDTTGEKANWFAYPLEYDPNLTDRRFLRDKEHDRSIFANEPEDVHRIFKERDELFVQYETDLTTYQIQNAMSGEVIEQTSDFKPVLSIEAKVKFELKDFIMGILERVKIQKNREFNVFKNADDAWLVRHEYKKEHQFGTRILLVSTSKYNRTIDEFNKPIELQLAEYKEKILSSILKALEKHKATDFKPIYVGRGIHGIEGIFEVGDGRKAHFWSVGAGGYNIQEYHHRYFVHLTKSDTEVEAIKLKIQLKHDAEMALEEN